MPWPSAIPAIRAAGSDVTETAPDPLAVCPLCSGEVAPVRKLARAEPSSSLGWTVWPSAALARVATKSAMAKLDLPRTDADHRRVLAVLRFLGAGARA